MKYSKEQIFTFVNNLKGYQGYIQFSDRPIENIWTSYSNIEIESTKGFIYEAHFYNGKESIAIKQINESWLVSKTDVTNISDKDKNSYISKKGKIKMAQIWEEENDPLCENLSVLKLKKVVFVGFEQGEQK